MKVNGLFLGIAILLSGRIIISFTEYIEESYIGLLILVLICLGNWYFAFDNSKQTQKQEVMGE